jgi:hypothetical protein
MESMPTLVIRLAVVTTVSLLACLVLTSLPHSSRESELEDGVAAAAHHLIPLHCVLQVQGLADLQQLTASLPTSICAQLLGARRCHSGFIVWRESHNGLISGIMHAVYVWK